MRGPFMRGGVPVSWTKTGKTLSALGKIYAIRRENSNATEQRQKMGRGNRRGLWCLRKMWGGQNAAARLAYEHGAIRHFAHPTRLPRPLIFPRFNRCLQRPLIFLPNTRFSRVRRRAAAAVSMDRKPRAKRKPGRRDQGRHGGLPLHDNGGNPTA